MPLLRQDVERIEEIAGLIKNERDNTVSQLIGRLQGLNSELDTAWDGPSQEQFYATYGNWISQLEKFSDTLYSIHQYLASVAVNFRELDEAARQAAAGATAIPAGAE